MSMVGYFVLQLITALLVVVPASKMVTSCTEQVKTDTLNITEEQNRKSFSVSKNTVIKISLPSQPGTGYSWAVANKDTKILTLTDESSAEGEGKPGGFEQAIFHFTAEQEGTEVITLHYRRVFEKEKPEKEFTVKVTVTPK